MRTLYDVCYSKGGGEKQSLDLYLPEGEGFPIFVYFHGGGFKTGDKRDAFAPMLAEFFTERGVGFASVNYRTYPDAKYPDYIEDGAAAVAYVKANAAEYGCDGRIIVGGSSAGGYLSMMLCYDGKYLGSHGISPSEIVAYIHDAGQCTTHFSVLAERGIKRYSCRVDEAAPLHHVGDAEVYSYQLFLVSDMDVPCRLEENELLVKTLGALKYDKSRFKLRVMEGYAHTEYVEMKDSEGESIFGKAILDFLLKKNLI